MSVWSYSSEFLPWLISHFCKTISWTLMWYQSFQVNWFQLSYSDFSIVNCHRPCQILSGWRTRQLLKAWNQPDPSVLSFLWLVGCKTLLFYFLPPWCSAHVYALSPIPAQKWHHVAPPLIITALPVAETGVSNLALLYNL